MPAGSLSAERLKSPVDGVVAALQHHPDVESACVLAFPLKPTGGLEPSDPIITRLSGLNGCE
jgi:hypothetical protein